MPGFANDAAHNTIVWADNVDFSGNQPVSRNITTNGQLLIGSSIAPNIRAGNLVSGDSSISINYSSPNIDLRVGAAATYISLSPYIVGQPGDTHAGFTTITTAIAQAVTDGASSSNPKNIYIKPGTYTESFTLPDGITLRGFDPSSFTSSIYESVKIVGTITKSAGTSKMVDCQVAPASGSNCFAISSGTLELTDCLVKATGTGVNFAFTTVSAKTLNIYGGSILGASNGTYSHDGSAATVRILYFRAVVNLQLSSITGAAGNFTIQHTATTISGRYNVTIPTFTIGLAYCGWSGPGGTGQPILTTGASTTGTALLGWSNIIFTTVGDTFLSIGNAAYLLRITGCSLDGSFTQQDTCVMSPSYFDDATSLVYRSGTAFAGSAWHQSQAQVQTTDATVTTLASLVVGEGEAVTLKGTITAAQSDWTNAVGGDFLIVARRAVAGNVTLVGAIVTNVESSSAATFTVDVDTGTQTVRIRITGVAATVYNWVTTYSYQYVISNT